jgi:predicted dehydrogenase
MAGVIVFGTGFGCLTHVRTLRQAGFEVRAIVGQNPERTAERARRFDVPKALTSLDEALTMDGVDAVAIATPPATHHALVLAAAAAGKHILCEKPFAADAAQGQAMCEAVERAGVIHLLGTEFRFSPGNAMLARVVQSGRIGDPIDAQFALDVPFVANSEAEVPAWWRDDGQSGGWLGAWGSHVIDQIRTTLGEIESVSAFLSLRRDRLAGADDGFNALLMTRSGASVTMRSCARSHTVSGATLIVGSDATAVLQGDHVVLHSASGAETLEVPKELEVLPPSPPPMEGLTTAYEFGHTLGTDFGPFTRLSEVLLGLIEGRDVSHWPAPATFRDGLACQRVMDAIRRSNARDGARESLDG